MSTNEELRFFAEPLTLAERADAAPVITGYAAVFNTLSREMPLSPGRTFKEVIRPGAFAEALASGADVLARYEHSQILGRTGNGTLRLVEDARGLRYEIDPPDTTVGKDLVISLRRGDVSASSFAFTVKPGGDIWRREGETLVREITSVKSLVDVSPVARGAYAATDVALRSYSESGLEQDAQTETLEPCAQRMAMRLALAERE